MPEIRRRRSSFLDWRFLLAITLIIFVVVTAATDIASMQYPSSH